MKMRLLATLLLLAVLTSGAWAGPLPRTVGGFTLGVSIHDYADLVRDDETGLYPDAPFLNEVPVKAELIPGVKSGSLYYGNCSGDDGIARIKLKLWDKSRGTFEKLHEIYLERFDTEPIWQGDAFHNVIAWEWKLYERDQEVRILLMWSRDPEMRPGVSVKMSMHSAIVNEYKCFDSKMKKMKSEAKSKGIGGKKMLDINHFIPH